MAKKFQPDQGAIAEEEEEEEEVGDEDNNDLGDDENVRNRKRSKSLGHTDDKIAESRSNMNLRRRSSDAALSLATSALTGTHKWKTRCAKNDPIVRFRRIAKLAVICLRLCRHSYESVEAAKNEFLSVVQVSKDMEASINKDGLYFDPNDFKANKERRLSLEAKRLLQLKPDIRTEKDIEYLQIALRRIKAFAEYPKRMQSKLVQVGWYEGYEPKRAIVRQGHVPQSFYFIISGTVVVTAYDKNAQASRTLVFLYQGMSFGELAVITRSVRQATVSSTTDTELLCISSQDFENVFMAGGRKNVNDPDHNKFIKDTSKYASCHSIECIISDYTEQKRYPVPQAHTSTRPPREHQCLPIPLLRGSVSVLKKLLKAVPELQNDMSDSDKVESCGPLGSLTLDMHATTYQYERYGQIEYYAKKRMCTRKKERRETKEGEHEEGKETYHSAVDMEKRLAQTLPGLFNQSDRLGVIDYDAIIDVHKSRVIPRVSTDVDQSVASLEDKVKSPDISKMAGSVKKGAKDVTYEIEDGEGAYFSSPGSQRKNTNKKDRQDKDMELLAKRRLEQAQAQQRNLAGRKTIAEEFDNKPIPDTEPTLSDLHPMFILVQILERRQYFGISQMIYSEQPSLSVVSNGAECIMISKKFFTDNSKAYAMHYLRLTECPFPDEEYMQANLQNYVNWEAHRSHIYHSLVRQCHDRVHKKGQYLPRLVGQYSHRTGPL